MFGEKYEGKKNKKYKSIKVKNEKMMFVFLTFY